MKKAFKITAAVLAGFLATIFLIVAGYVAYISIQYYRIEDNQNIEIINNKSGKVSLNTSLKVSTYNIGFGAYSKDFSFFMDSGETLDGKIINGTGSKAKNKAEVIKNTTGAVNTILEQDVDFALFQEVDTSAHRSHFYNQYEHIQNKFENFSTSFSSNFHSAFLFYPLTDPHGKVDAGIVTLSKYAISSATRRSFPIDESFPTKFFDLDRCLQVTRLPIENSDKELVLINLHMSAYDEGGLIRAKQVKLLNEILKTEKDNGNYVVAGGDFNHDIANSKTLFETNRKKAEWVYTLENSDLTSGYRFVANTNTSTCRSSDGPYVKGESYEVVIDGFICSDNVETISVSNIDTGYEYSDHNPVVLNFKLV